MGSFTGKDLLCNNPHSGTFGLFNTAEQPIMLQELTCQGKDQHYLWLVTSLLLWIFMSQNSLNTWFFTCCWCSPELLGSCLTCGCLFLDRSQDQHIFISNITVQTEDNSEILKYHPKNLQGFRKQIDRHGAPMSPSHMSCDMWKTTEGNLGRSIKNTLRNYEDVWDDKSCLEG